MSVSLKITPNCDGPKLETKDLPQDGQRLITAIEDATITYFVKRFEDLRKQWLESENLSKDLYDLIARYTFNHGEIPLHFSARFWVTHDFEVHKMTYAFVEKLPELLRYLSE